MLIYNSTTYNNNGYLGHRFPKHFHKSESFDPKDFLIQHVAVVKSVSILHRSAVFFLFSLVSLFL